MSTDTRSRFQVAAGSAHSQLQNATTTLEAFSIILLTDYRKLRTANFTLVRPAVLSRDGLEFLDFGAKPDAAISVRLVADMDDARRAAYLLGGIPGHFRGHTQGRFDRYANLQGSR